MFFKAVSMFVEGDMDI